MKTALLALYAIVLVAGSARAEVDSPESSPVVQIEQLRQDANAAGRTPDVIVAPRPTPAQQLRAAIDAAQERLFVDLDAARAAMAKASGPADRMQANRELQRRKLAFEVEVFELQLDYSRAIEATDRIEALEETLRVARQRLESAPVKARNEIPATEGGR